METNTPMTSYCILLNLTKGPSGLSRWEAISITNIQNLQNIPNFGSDPNIEAVDLYTAQTYLNVPIPLTGNNQQIREWMRSFEIRFNDIKNRRSTDYLFIELYKRPGQSRWEALAIISTDTIQRNMSQNLNLPDTKYISVSEANRYFEQPYPILGTRTQIRTWLNGFEQAYNAFHNL